MSIYLRGDDGELICESLCVISDDLKHDTVFVREVMPIAVQHCKLNHQNFRKFENFSDGCAEQYKNYKHMINLCGHEKEFGFPAVWNFFATSHGKGPCDGIGGTIKRLARDESLRRTKNTINNFQAFTEFCLGNFENIKFFVLTSDHLQSERPQMEDKYAAGKTVPGTRSFHQIIPTGVNLISCKRLSSDDFFICNHKFGESLTREEYQTGKYVAVVYDQDWYVGLIEERDGDEYMINFMHPRNPPGSVHWPARKDSCLTPLNNILCQIQVPDPSTNRAREFVLQDNESAEIIALFISFSS